MNSAVSYKYHAGQRVSDTMLSKNAAYSKLIARKVREAAATEEPRERAELHLQIARTAIEHGDVLIMDRSLREARSALREEYALLTHILAVGSMNSGLRQERAERRDGIYSRQIAVERLLGSVRDRQYIDYWDAIHVDALPVGTATACNGLVRKAKPEPEPVPVPADAGQEH